MDDFMDIEAELESIPEFYDEAGMTMLPLDMLEAHPDNPRKNIGDVTELADSIRESGILQNLTVVPFEGKYRVIIGHRRMTAARLAGLTEVPCAVVDMDYKTQVATMLSENMQRSDLTVIEQAQGIQMMFDFGESVESISKKTGFSQSTVRKRLSVAALPADEAKAAEERGGTLEQFIKLNELNNEDERREMLQYVGTNDFNWKYQVALRKQTTSKNIPKVEQWCKLNGIKAVDSNKRWTSQFRDIKTYDVSSEYFKAEEPLLTLQELADYPEIFYCFTGTTLVFMEKLAPEKKGKPKKSQAEIDGQRAEKELREKFAQAYRLRRQFVKEFNSPVKYEKNIYCALIEETCAYIVSYHGTDTKYLKNEMGLSNAYVSLSETYEATRKFMGEDPCAAFKAVYALFNDSEISDCIGFSRETDHRPRYRKNKSLESLYTFLKSCGYEMSREEALIVMGVSELYEGVEEE